MLTVGGLDIGRIGCIPRIGGIAIENNGNLAFVSSFEVIAVCLDCTTMGDKDVVANDPGLAGRVSLW